MPDYEEMIRSKRSEELGVVTFADIIYNVITISRNSPYWKDTEPGTEIKFANKDIADKAIKEGYAKDILTKDNDKVI